MTNENGVIVEEFKGFTIPLENGGYYRETLITNNTNENIVIVGNNNNRTTVTPDSPQGNGTVVVTLRSTNGKRHVNGVELAMDTQKYTIPRELIEKGFYYLEQCDIILATPEVGESVTHPTASKTYVELLDEVMQSVISPDATKLLFTVNDPMRRMDHLFGCIGGHCFKIPCTSIREPGGCTLMAYTVDNNKPSLHAKEDIESISTNGSISVPVFDTLLSLGITADDAYECHSNKQNIIQAEMAKIVAQRVASQRKEADTIQEQDSARHKIIVAELDVIIVGLKSNKNKLEQEIVNLIADNARDKKIVDSWERIKDYEEAREKRSDTKKTIKSKLDEQEHKTARARWQASSEPTKVIVTIVGIVVSAVVGAIIKELVADKK